MENRKINNEFEKIAKELINTEPSLAYIKGSEVNITYLESDNCKKNGPKKLVLGECEKISAKNKWAISADFTITIYVNNIIGFTAAQLKALLHHELLHVGIDVDAEGKEVYRVNRHDIEEFKEIIDKYGEDWADSQLKLFDGE